MPPLASPTSYYSAAPHHPSCAARSPAPHPPCVAALSSTLPHTATGPRHGHSGGAVAVLARARVLALHRRASRPDLARESGRVADEQFNTD
jgi:hypothetical protein